LDWVWVCVKFFENILVLTRPSLCPNARLKAAHNPALGIVTRVSVGIEIRLAEGQEQSYGIHWIFPYLFQYKNLSDDFNILRFAWFCSWLSAKIYGWIALSQGRKP